MKKINYQKILNQLITEYPHEIKKIKQVLEDSKNDKERVTPIELKRIIDSEIWDSSEKAELLDIFGYNCLSSSIDYVDINYSNTSSIAFIYALHKNNQTGFEGALQNIFRNSKNRKQAIHEIFKFIRLTNASKALKLKYIDLTLAYLSEDEKKEILSTRYEICYNGIKNNSIMSYIISGSNLDLIKKYIGYVSDINIYLSMAVATKDIEIVKHFLSLGADINYYSLSEVTPLKTAIRNNDYEMFMFLISNGADINLRGDFLNALADSPEEIDTDNLKRKEKGVARIQYLIESYPIEYATKIKKADESNIGINVYFQADMPDAEDSICIKNWSKDNEEVQNRGKIVETLFDKLKDKSSINMTDIIVSTFISRDINTFKKYIAYVKENKCPIDFNYLSEMYYSLKVFALPEFIEPFLDFIEAFDKNMIISFWNILYEKERYDKRFYITDFNRKVLEKIPLAKRREIILIPYTNNLETLQVLLDLGFPLNQKTPTGDNILFNQIGKINYSLDKETRDLFYYLLDNLDLTEKDKDGNNIIYYGLIFLNTSNIYMYCRKDEPNSLTDSERFLIDLIKKMPKEAFTQEVINSMKELLDEKDFYQEEFGDKIHYEYCYQMHQDLFTALKEKGITLSESIFISIFDILNDPYAKHNIESGIDIAKTKTFIFEVLDENTEVQALSINEISSALQEFIKRKKDLTLEDFKYLLKGLNKAIKSLKTFYNKNIKKKLIPEEYLEYAKEKYNTTYDNLDSYLLKMIITGLMNFGNDKLDEFLAICPDFDINTCIWREDIGFNYWNHYTEIYNEIYDENEEVISDERFFIYADIYDEDYVLFSGGLVQYAILNNDLELLEKLYSKGANLKLQTDEYDYTWDYVSSKTILAYLESILGKKEYSEFSSEEKDYYRALINKEE